MYLRIRSVPFSIKPSLFPIEDVTRDERLEYFSLRWTNGLVCRTTLQTAVLAQFLTGQDISSFPISIILPRISILFSAVS